MKQLYIFILVICLPHFSVAQAPDIEWQNTIGGDVGDILSITQTSDGGFIIGGSSNSGISGDKSESCFGNNDYWVLKVDSIGNILWQNTIGGGGIDDLFSLSQTSDGGYVLGGTSNSDISGNKTVSAVSGSFDYWLVKLDSAGNIEWQKDIGGSGSDNLRYIQQTDDFGYIIGGYSNSPISGDKTEASILGSDDYWIVKLNSLGSIEWDSNIGGNNQDVLWVIYQTIDKGFILGGSSYSGISGDKTEVNIAGSQDYWIIKLDSTGTIVWQNTIGGNFTDFLSDIKQTSDRGYIVGGGSYSGISGDKTESSRGVSDCWILKLDSLGNIEWQKTIGGDLEDGTYVITQTPDGGFISAGISKSGISGDKTESNIGFYDYWVIKLDNVGNILWQKTLGGWNDDVLLAADKTIDGGFILGGWSNSPISGDKIEDNTGSADFWIIKLQPESCENIVFYSDIDIDGFGNPTDSVLACFAPFGYISNAEDCNDTLAEINPGMSEVCNAVDDNCNGLVDDGLLLQILYADGDGDDFGNPLIDTISCFVEIPGFVTDSTDCDDENNLIHARILYFADTDSDSYGNAIDTIMYCDLFPPTGFVADSADCDDSNPYIYPGAIEIQNGLDDNCNEVIDEGFNSIQNSTAPDFIIYPNPNNGFFQFKLLDFNGEETKVHIFDMTGREIYYAIYYNELIHVSLPTPASGVYGIYVSNENHNLFKTFLIQTN